MAILEGQKPILTPEDVAELLGMKPRRIVDLLREGEFPGFKAGREWRIRRDELQEYIEQHSNKRRSA